MQNQASSEFCRRLTELPTAGEHWSAVYGSPRYLLATSRTTRTAEHLLSTEDNIDGAFCARTNHSTLILIYLSSQV
ncbi:hypothetical protein J6590_036725 [Homalodisca vitripennis]|nr:hypothetical protein J6590_036725 [Homalodisca vitripennis]